MKYEEGQCFACGKIKPTTDAGKMPSGLIAWLCRKCNNSQIHKMFDIKKKG